MFGSLGMPEILMILLVILLLFGARRIPEVMKAMGQGLREFKSATSSATQEIQKAVNEAPDDTNKSEPS